MFVLVSDRSSFVVVSDRSSFVFLVSDGSWMEAKGAKDGKAVAERCRCCGKEGWHVRTCGREGELGHDCAAGRDDHERIGEP